MINNSGNHGKGLPYVPLLIRILISGGGRLLSCFMSLGLCTLGTQWLCSKCHSLILCLLWINKFFYYKWVFKRVIYSLIEFLFEKHGLDYETSYIIYYFGSNRIHKHHKYKVRIIRNNIEKIIFHVAFLKFNFFINIRWANLMKSTGSDGGKPREFNHPFFQACCMFFGEFLCLLCFKVVYYWLKRKQVLIFFSFLIS